MVYTYSKNMVYSIHMELDCLLVMKFISDTGSANSFICPFDGADPAPRLIIFNTRLSELWPYRGRSE